MYMRIFFSKVVLQKLENWSFSCLTMYLFFLKQRIWQTLTCIWYSKWQMMADVILILDDGHWQPVFLKFPTYLYIRLMYMTIHKYMQSWKYLFLYCASLGLKISFIIYYMELEIICNLLKAIFFENPTLKINYLDLQCMLDVFKWIQTFSLCKTLVRLF